MHTFSRYALTRAGIQLGEKLNGFHNSFHRVQMEADQPELQDMSQERYFQEHKQFQYS